jgi:ComF family protein
MQVRLSTLLSGLRQNAQIALDFLLPVRCLLCNDSDQSNFSEPFCVRGIPFCRSCQAELVPDIPRFCNRCGASVGLFSRVDTGCPHCRNRRLKFDQVICLAMYEGVLRDYMLRSKWARSPCRIQNLARLLWKHRHRDIRQFAPDCILPIPQHWSLRCIRHFNAAGILAEAISDEMVQSGLNVSCDHHILRRNRTVQLQKRRSLRHRFKNQKDSFSACAPEKIRGKRVLIVDDVLTTGATCSEAASVLKAHGALACAVLIAGRVLAHPSPVSHLTEGIRDYLSESG